MKNSITVACRLGALTDAEQNRRARLFADFQAAIQSVRELLDGYDVVISSTAMPAVLLDELVRLESRCCSFLTFSIHASPALTLRITGSQDAKRFLTSEFGLGKRSAPAED